MTRPDFLRSLAALLPTVLALNARRHVSDPFVPLYPYTAPFRLDMADLHRRIEQQTKQNAAAKERAMVLAQARFRETLERLQA